jgi:hypothetical protein
MVLEHADPGKKRRHVATSTQTELKAKKKAINKKQVENGKTRGRSDEKRWRSAKTTWECGE